VPAPQPAFKLVIAGTVGKFTGAYQLTPVLANASTKGTGIKVKATRSARMGMPVISANLGVTGIDRAYLSRVTVIEDNDAKGFGAVAQRRRTAPNERQ
jgi:hypothetical protein